jgi:hypothetical protein
MVKVLGYHQREDKQGDAEKQQVRESNLLNVGNSFLFSLNQDILPADSSGLSLGRQIHGESFGEWHLYFDRCKSGLRTIDIEAASEQPGPFLHAGQTQVP